MDIQNKVVLITGASAGIGLATARRFAAAGAKVALAARSTDALQQLASELQQQGASTLVIPTDVRNQVAVNQMVETTVQHFGQLDILINNAGQAAAGTVAEVSIENFRQILELNVFGALYAMQAVIPRMRQNGGGIIINVSSTVSKMNIPGLSAYASTKSALNMLSATARQELAGNNIRVITLYPRLTATDFGKNSLGNQQVRQQQRANRPANVVVDTAEHVAEKMLEAAQKEPAEQYMDA